MVGTIETRKNPEFFVELYEELRRRAGSGGGGGAGRQPALVWNGRVGHGGHQALRRLEGLRRAGLFHLLDGLDAADLPRLYRGAEALVYPSLSEGFGLPLVEAMASGTPVIAADTTCLPEVVGDGGLVLPLDRPTLWADALERLLQGPTERAQAARRALQRAQAFSWEETARATGALYEEALAARHAAR